jgi:putative endonuclease
MDKPFYVYLIKSISHGHLYVGMTQDVEKRILEHNRGKSTYTKSFMPWELIYTEKLGTRVEARKREKYLKSTAGKNYLRKKGVI